MTNNDDNMITLVPDDILAFQEKIFKQKFRILADCVTIMRELLKYAGKHNGKIPANGIPLPAYLDSFAIIRTFSEFLEKTPVDVQEKDGKKYAIFEE